VDRLPQRMERIGSSLITMAVTVVGSAEAVQKALNCSDADFAAYRAGRKQPNQAEFETLVSIIIREQDKIIQRNREVLAKIRANSNKR